jgi:hypothetical protein
VGNISLDVHLYRLKLYDFGERPGLDGNPSTEFFFGFLQFDSNPNAPGAVPGFGPLPQPKPSVTSVATRE